jgi:hypothetical protein
VLVIAAAPDGGTELERKLEEIGEAR